MTTTSTSAINNVIKNLTNTITIVINTEISDHYGIQIIIENDLPKVVPETYQIVPSLKPKLIESSTIALKEEDWELRNAHNSFNNMYNIFQDRFIFHINSEIPFKKFKNNSNIL